MSFEYILWLPDLCFYWIIECVNECVLFMFVFCTFSWGLFLLFVLSYSKLFYFAFFYYYSLGTDCFIT